MKRQFRLLMWRLKAWWHKWFGRKYTANVCSHAYKRFASVKIFGETFHYQLGQSEDYCGQCQADMAIRCGCCSRPILTHDLITLHSVDLDLPPEKRVPEGAVLYGGALVCCCRYPCAEMGRADAIGKWVTPGAVRTPQGGHEWLEMIES